MASMRILILSRTAHIVTHNGIHLRTAATMALLPATEALPILPLTLSRLPSHHPKCHMYNGIQLKIKRCHLIPLKRHSTSFRTVVHYRPPLPRRHRPPARPSLHRSNSPFPIAPLNIRNVLTMTTVGIPAAIVPTSPCTRGGPDISLAGPGSDAVRYRLGAPRRANSDGDRGLIPSLPTFSGSDHSSQNDRGSSEGESGPYSHQRPPPPRRYTAPSRSSRSPSPGTPPISGTLAVIKAQAFGALRRTRTRQKKTGEGASRAAMEALEARGIGMGVGVSTSNKRQRLDSDDGDMQP